MNPKIADFGMARLFDLDETQGNTSRIVGTYGYMAPEYVMYGEFSVKSDVFDVLVLEIAWKNWRAGAASNVMDPTLRSSSGSLRKMMRCIHIGLLCVQENVADRPTMTSVALMLAFLSLSQYLQSLHFLCTVALIQKMPLLGENNSEASNFSKTKEEESANFSLNEASVTDLYPR